MRLRRLKISASFPKITAPTPKRTMKIVIIQLSPEGESENCLAIIGVDTLNTVSLSTAKKIR